MLHVQDSQSEQEVLGMLQQLRQTFAGMLKRAEWMSHEARQTATTKLMVRLLQRVFFCVYYASSV